MSQGFVEKFALSVNQIIGFSVVFFFFLIDFSQKLCCGAVNSKQVVVVVLETLKRVRNTEIPTFMFPK